MGSPRRFPDQMFFLARAVWHDPPGRAGSVQDSAAILGEDAMTAENAHDWFRERLASLLAEADQAGFSRDVAQAVITDLMNGVFASSSPPPDENWAHDAGEPVGASSEMPLHETLPPEPVESVQLFPIRAPFRTNF
jgi:hypothetical protein